MKNLRQTIFLLLCTALAFTAADLRAQLRPGVRTVFIDPGHGGDDPGAVNNKLKIKEKDIVLKVALALGDMINENYPDVNVMYTRKTDVRIDLAQRGKMANDAKADLFISIHINAAEATAARGTETIVMGTADNARNLETSKLENSVIAYEEDYSTVYMGFDNSTESYIMFSLMQYANQEQSIGFADLVQKQFTKSTNMPNRGVKQQVVLVLWRTAMPSALTEFGFITNESDAKHIGSAAGIRNYATCLFNAFSEYKSEIEGRSNTIILDPSAGAVTTTGATGAGTATGTGTEANTGAGAGAATGANAGNGAVIASESSTGAKAVYRIQVSSSPRKIPKNSATFGPYRGEVKEIIIDGRYKYFTRETTSYREITSLLKEVRRSIKDAFVVAFLDDRQITVDRARKINKE